MYVHTKLFDHRDLITIQVGHWTLDNAANNGTFMEELERLLHQRDINFDHMDRRIMCFPHVINICCQHILTKFTNVNLVDIAGVTALPSAANNHSKKLLAPTQSRVAEMLCVSYGALGNAATSSMKLSLMAIPRGGS
jgi:hypothetical protein